MPQIHRSSTLAWQVVFLQEGQLVEQMSVDEAHTLGYHLNFTLGRMVFRMPYGQPHSVVSVVNGLPLEVVHLVLFSRQLWEVLMVDMVAACNLYEGSFDGATLSWKMPTVVTPLVLGHSEFKTKQISLGVDGQLLDDQTTTSWGYIREVSAETVTIAVPYGAKGGHGKSFVLHNVYTEFYTVHLYYEQVFMDESGFETRLRLVRPMATPLLEHHPFTINQTVLEERKFTVFVGNFPTDVELVAVKLNRQDFTPLEADQHGYPIVKLSHSNSTHAYVISVPFEDSLVPKMYSFEGVLRYSLDITYTLNVMPQKDSYYHLASVVALINDVFPPMFSGLCMENGIRFKMDHQEFDYMWEVCIGQFPLTEQLSAERGYYMQNGSQSMILEVPLLSIGYIYEDITLQNFFGTFEILARDPKTMEIQQSSAKRCLFKTTEFVACSSDGIMTVVSDLTKAIPGANPARATLLDKTCRPKELDENRVLFTFGVNTCGTRVQYHFVNESKTWTEAQRYCRDNYTDLATVYNMEDMNRLIDAANGTYNGLAWIGLFESVQDHVWQWSLDDDDFYGEGERDFRDWDESGRDPDNVNGFGPVIGLRVKFTSKESISESGIKEVVLQQLKEELTRRGIPGTITLHLRRTYRTTP
ncbi:uncharacterized protein LOC115812502 [Chanos chanos]|uniref:Uncharacterized protein LOC115812502 n=1 Tax=Chanos chanos TaxID=29144 RepID=A0A6J2VDC8_CHACN|nr:uncharacterized protein LOC115812502 [Chanos chanos]